MPLAKSSAVITGAAQGIGEACALRLAREGVRRFILIDRQGEKLRKVADRLRAEGSEAETLPLDLTDVPTLLRSLGEAVRSRQPIDILVNAAGTTARGSLEDTTPELFDAIFALNLRAPFFVMQTLAPHMPAGGVIVNICSMLAYGGPPFLTPYSVSKAALGVLTKSVANALKERRIHAFGINLGWTLTPAEHEVQTRGHGLAENWADAMGVKQPFGRLLVPEDPAGLVAFLCSDNAAMMTGAIIDLDQFVAGTVNDNPGVALIEN